MPLQNRIDPFGKIQAVDARGMFTGNRGVIHDPDTKTLLSRRWTTKAWIVCTLSHPRGAMREPMGRNTRSGRAGWTELFFLDEVTALSAGHRPCFYCRREAASHFLHCIGQRSAPAMDALLHEQRLRRQPSVDRSLPDGAMIAVGDKAYAVRNGLALRWSFAGYGAPEPLPDGARLLTPKATVAALQAGYSPIWHPNASSA